MDSAMQDHTAHLSRYDQARATLTEAVVAELKHEAERPALKDAAIRRLMGQVNPQNAKGDLHSASSAEKVVEMDPTYADYLLAGRQLVARKMRAQTECDVALERARMVRTLAALVAV